MKTKVVLFGAMMFTSVASFAVTGAQNGSKYGTGQDSVECVQNLSLTSQYAKQGDYKSAAEFWEKCYANCPQSSKNIYIYGAKILADQLKNEKNPAKQGEIFDGYNNLTVSDKIFLITDLFLQKSDDEIAKILAVSPGTVRSRRSKIKKKKNIEDVDA